MKPQNKQRLYLPSTLEAEAEQDRAWVVIDIAPLRVGDIAQASQGMPDAELRIRGITDRIMEWNFTDPSGEPLPITYENVCKIDILDYQFIQKQIPDGTSVNFSAAEKKT